ncbi:MAG: hypothetical protein Q8S00_31710, partial [Deltaproteobacteria bacterium]|nr:hypothetical protein [Deltaproteobacteria bacterium]
EMNPAVHEASCLRTGRGLPQNALAVSCSLWYPLIAATQRLAFYPQNVAAIKRKADPGKIDASAKSRRIESWEKNIQFQR